MEILTQILTKLNEILKKLNEFKHDDLLIILIVIGIIYLITRRRSRKHD